MANVNINLVPVITTFPFDLDPVAGTLLMKSALPRARLTFQVNDGAIAAKIATNTTTINITNTLPVNFAYVFEYCTVQVAFATSTSDAGTMDDTGAILVNLGDGAGGRRASLFSRGATADSLAAGSQIIYRSENVFPSPIYNSLSVTPTIILRLSERDAGATVAGLLSSIVSVLQYDIDQVFNVGINYPIPVSLR